MSYLAFAMEMRFWSGSQNCICKNPPQFSVWILKCKFFAQHICCDVIAIGKLQDKVGTSKVNCPFLVGLIEGRNEASQHEKSHNYICQESHAELQLKYSFSFSTLVLVASCYTVHTRPKIFDFFLCRLSPVQIWNLWRSGCGIAHVWSEKVFEHWL